MQFYHHSEYVYDDKQSIKIENAGNCEINIKRVKNFSVIYKYDWEDQAQCPFAIEASTDGGVQQVSSFSKDYAPKIFAVGDIVIYDDKTKKESKMLKRENLEILFKHLPLLKDKYIIKLGEYGIFTLTQLIFADPKKISEIGPKDDMVKILDAARIELRKHHFIFDTELITNQLHPEKEFENKVKNEKKFLDESEKQWKKIIDSKETIQIQNERPFEDKAWYKRFRFGAESSKSRHSSSKIKKFSPGSAGCSL